MKKTKDTIHITEFRCLTPIRHLEKCFACAKGGKCRERGLIIQLLSGKKKLDYGKLEEKKVKVTRVIKTSAAYPAIWQAFTEDDRKLHIRYRWGYLSVEDWRTGKFVFAASLGENDDGIMSYEELKKHTEKNISWPDEEEEGF